MKTKKTEGANLDNRRGTFILLGLSLSLLLVLYAFELKTTDTITDTYTNGAMVIPDDVVLPTEREKPKIVSVPKVILGGPLQIVTWDIPEIDFVTPDEIESPEDLPIPVKAEIDNPDEIHPTPQYEAEFPGGNDALFAYLAKTIKYPNLDIELGNEGIVYVRFVVRKDGRVDNVEIVRGISESIDNEAKRVVGEMPNWKPARMGPKNVHSYFSLPIAFKLH